MGFQRSEAAGSNDVRQRGVHSILFFRATSLWTSFLISPSTENCDSATSQAHLGTDRRTKPVLVGVLSPDRLIRSLPFLPDRSERRCEAPEGRFDLHPPWRRTSSACRHPLYFQRIHTTDHVLDVMSHNRTIDVRHLVFNYTGTNRLILGCTGYGVRSGPPVPIRPGSPAGQSVIGNSLPKRRSGL